MHAETNYFRKISMLFMPCGPNRLDWDKVPQLVCDTFNTSTVAVVVYLRETTEHELPQRATKHSNSLPEAQKFDEALNLVKHGVS